MLVPRRLAWRLGIPRRGGVAPLPRLPRLAATSPGLGVNDDPAGVTLQDCVDALVADIDTLGTDGITLVGHSWSGYVIADAVPAVAARLRRAVFWSAFAPDNDRSLYDEVPPDYQQLFAQLAAASAGNTVALPLPHLHRPAGQRPRLPGRRRAAELRPVRRRRRAASGRIRLAPLRRAHQRDAGQGPGSHESLFTRPAELADALAAAETG